MPENETLNPDKRTASRWRPLKDRLDHGESPNDIFPDLENEFDASLQKVWKQWRGRGVDPAALFDAAVNNPEVLHDLVRLPRMRNSLPTSRCTAVTVVSGNL
jgi:hypothetical protein